MHFHIAACIEARKDEDMPERALFAAELNQIPIYGAKQRLTDEAVAWFRAQYGEGMPKPKGKKGKGSS